LASTTWKKRPALNLFSNRDPQSHRDDKRKTAVAFSLSSILQSEAEIDSCSILLKQQLDRLSSQGQPVDLGQWIHYYTFDVVGEVTFARKFGFLEQGKDIDGIIQTLAAMLPYFAICGKL
jgi:Cytochrome P450